LVVVKILTEEENGQMANSCLVSNKVECNLIQCQKQNCLFLYSLNLQIQFCSLNDGLREDAGLLGLQLRQGCIPFQATFTTLLCWQNNFMVHSL
jgi:hypothetical protein